MSQPPMDMLRTRALAQRLHGLTKLLDLTCRLAAEQDLDRILQLVTNQVCAALDCERASLFQYDADRRELVTRLATELEIAEIRHSVDVGIAGWVASHREPANIPDPSLDPRWLPDVDRQTGFQTESILATPLISVHNDRLLGVLELLNKHGGPFSEFDAHLLQAFGAHAAVALERASLIEELRQSERLQASVELARHVQAGFLPEHLPQPEGYEIAAWWQPAEGVAGDYYDVLPLCDGRLAVAVADVSGHGVGPSLIMASARAMLHILTKTCTAPDQIMALLSDSIAPDLHDGRFITFFFGVLDLQKHTFEFVNAGHAPAAHFEQRTGAFQPLRSTGLPLGICPERRAGVGPRVQLEPGDVLLLATDGAIELRDENQTMFGQERLQDIVAAHHQSSAADIVAEVRSAIAGFQTTVQHADDITLLVIKRC